ncbi:hypothetical protein [Variovorax boronicumulans]
MPTFKKQFTGVPNGDIYPKTYEAGDECPPELVAGAQSLDALDGEGSGSALTRNSLDRALADLPGGNTDPDYVVGAMRSYFGDLFTADDESRVRDLVKPVVVRLSDGLTVDEIKAALAEKSIAIPEGVTRKAELAALLDGGA